MRPELPSLQNILSSSRASSSFMCTFCSERDRHITILHNELKCVNVLLLIFLYHYINIMKHMQKCAFLTYKLMSDFKTGVNCSQHNFTNSLYGRYQTALNNLIHFYITIPSYNLIYYIKYLLLIQNDIWLKFKMDHQIEKIAQSLSKG